MKYKHILTFAAHLFAASLSAQSTNEIESLKIEIQVLKDDLNIAARERNVLQQSAQKSTKDIRELKRQNEKQRSQLKELSSQGKRQQEKADSLDTGLSALEATQTTDRSRFNEEIGKTNSTVATNEATMSSLTKWGIALLVLTIIGFGTYLYLRRRKDSSSIGEVRKAQDALQEVQAKLQAAQSKLQEDALKLDNQMLSLIEKQMNEVKTAPQTNVAEIDHSLALKVADEIVRIELNLSRMDASVKGHKQLSKAVERIKNNFQANGYEIVDMLNTSYNEGMRVIANFVPDESLAEGEQKITGITKPQINYNGVMIQKAQVTVSQNI